MTGPLLRSIYAVGGVKLQDAWVDGPRSYLGIAIHGFPNLFTITGPSSPSVLVICWCHRAACRLGGVVSNGCAKKEKPPSSRQTVPSANGRSTLNNASDYPKANSWCMVKRTGQTTVHRTWAGSAPTNSFATRLRPVAITVLKRLSQEERKLMTRLRPGFFCP